MKQVFEVTLTDVDDTLPWTIEQFRKAVEAMMDNEFVEVKEIKDKK